MKGGGRTFSSPGRFNGLPIGKPKPSRPKTWSASQPYRGRALSRADQLRPRVASPTAGPSRYNHRLGRFQPWGSQHDTPWLFPGTTHARGITFLLPSVVAGRPAVYPQAPLRRPTVCPRGGSQFPTAPPDVRDRLYGHLQIASVQLVCKCLASIAVRDIGIRQVALSPCCSTPRRVPLSGPGLWGL